MMTKEEIGCIIRQSRIAAGLTQLQVGSALKRPQTTIAAWEAGRSQPDANTLFELFRVLNRSVDEAFGFTETPLSSEAIKIAMDYDRMDRHGKAVTRSVINGELERIDSQPIHLHYNSTKVPIDRDCRLCRMELWIVKCNNLTSEADFCISMSDDSMAYDYVAGDTILIKRQTSVKDHETGLFFIDGKTVIGVQLGTAINPTHPEYSDMHYPYYWKTSEQSGENKQVGECIGLVLGKLEPEWVIERWSSP